MLQNIFGFMVKKSYLCVRQAITVCLDKNYCEMIDNIETDKEFKKFVKRIRKRG